METTPNRPLLRYHGGKWKLAEWIIANLPAHRVYVEPFGGAASVLMRKPRSYAETYNELDGQIVNLFRMVRDHGKELEQKLRDTPFARAEFALAYEDSDCPMEQARRTVVRSFMGFGSAAASGAKTGFRFDPNRSGTTPAHDWSNFPGCLDGMISRLRGVVIECSDASKLMLSLDGDDVLYYVDPPYVLDTRSIKNPYCKKGYRFELTDEDHIALSETLHSLRGMVVLSGYDCALYARLYAGWERIDRKAMADGARQRTETLWFNPAAWEKRHSQGLMFA